MGEGYLVIDIGTGNFRVGLIGLDGKVISIQRRDMSYVKDNDFPDATSFDPNKLLKEIKGLIRNILSECPDVNIKAITSTSQRQGIVLLDRDGKAMIGLPNIDGRGQAWELKGADFDYVYKKTGRWPTKTFSALKLIGIRERQPVLWENVNAFTSISDWIGYEFTNRLVYENSQASETLVLDLKNNKWSEELCAFWGISNNWLPEIKESGTILGNLRMEVSQELVLKNSVPFIVGGADTQLAVKGTNPQIGDIVIVSGTTTPIVKIADAHLSDEKARCWVNRHVHRDEFIIETNAGASGLNYQRLKNLLLPDKSYKEIEEGILKLKNLSCIASFSTSASDKQLRLSSGGFLLSSPFDFNLKIEDFFFGIIFDIASSIKYNFDVLEEITGHSKGYVLGCGGGFQSKVLPQILSNLLNEKVIIKEGYKYASLIGGVQICNEALGEKSKVHLPVKTYEPSDRDDLLVLYEKWKEFRQSINKDLYEEKKLSVN